MVQEELKDLETICQINGKMDVYIKCGKKKLYAEKYMNIMLEYGRKYLLFRSKDLEDYDIFHDHQINEKHDLQYLCGFFTYRDIVEKIERLILRELELRD